MVRNNFVKVYKDDAKYYDTIKEVEAIKSLKLRKKSNLLDIGAGVGRLAIPLSKYFIVTALDIDKRLISQIRQKKIKKITSEILSYCPSNKFSLILLAYPNFGPEADINKIIRHLCNNLMRRNAKLILIMGCNKSGNSKWLSDYKKSLSPYFNRIHESFIKTGYNYDNYRIAFSTSKFRDEFFRRKKLNKNDLDKIKRSLKDNTDAKGRIYISAHVKLILYKKK